MPGDAFADMLSENASETLSTGYIEAVAKNDNSSSSVTAPLLAVISRKTGYRSVPVHGNEANNNQSTVKITTLTDSRR